MRSLIVSYGTLAIVMLLWSGNMIVGRAVHEAVPPFTLAFVRWTGASLLALPFALRHLASDRRILVANWKIVLLLGLTGVAAFNALAYSGLHHTTATNAMLLQASVPAFVLLANWLFFGTRARLLQICGVMASIAGVVLIVLRGDPLAILGLGVNSGDLLILCGAISWGAYTSLLKLRPPVHPLTFLLATFMIGALAMAPLCATELAHGATVTLNKGVIGAFAYVAVLPSLVAYHLYNGAVQDLGAGRAGQTITMTPLFGALLAAVLLGEALHPYHLAGMTLILAGIAIGAWRGRPS